jgi:hypothetical protein
MTSHQSARQTQELAQVCDFKLKSLDQRRTATERAVSASYLADELATGRITLDEAAERYCRLMENSPELLEICRGEGIADALEACRRRIERAAFQRSTKTRFR